MENFMKNEFTDLPNATSIMANHHQQYQNDLKFQSCKKKLNFSINSSNKHPLKHELSSSSMLQFKPSNTKRNERERKRVKTINDYFSKLQKFLPNSKQTKKLSKVETLKAAIDYIEYLQLNKNGMSPLGSTLLKSQKDSRNKLTNKLNNNENTSSLSSSTSSSLSSSASTSSCYSTPTVSPLQISHNNNNNNILNNNTNNHNNIQVHVNINSNHLQASSQSAYQYQPNAIVSNTLQQPILQFNNNNSNRTPTKPYYNNTSSPLSPNQGNYYLMEEPCYSKSLLTTSSENYNNNLPIYNNCQQNAMCQQYPVNNQSNTEFIHQNYYQQQQHSRIVTSSTPKRNLDTTSFSVDDGIDVVNSSTASSNEDYSTTSAIYTSSNGQHIIAPSNEICSRNQNYDAKAECFLTDNLLLDFM
jgi:hypothetical protein